MKTMGVDMYPWFFAASFLVALVLASPAAAQSEEDYLGLSLIVGVLRPSETIKTTAPVKYSYSLNVPVDLNTSYIRVSADPFYGQASRGNQKGSGEVTSYGAMVDGSVQLPLSVGTVKVTPRLGLGYGALSSSGSSQLGDSNSLLQTQISMSTNGIYFVTGLELDVSNTLLIQFDYSESLLSGGHQEVSGFASLLPSPTKSSGGFQRMRGSIGYRITASWELGLQFIQRTFTLDTSMQGPTSVDLLSGPQQTYGLRLGCRL